MDIENGKVKDLTKKYRGKSEVEVFGLEEVLRRKRKEELIKKAKALNFYGIKENNYGRHLDNQEF